MQIQVGIITISDRATANEYKDLGGPALREAAQKAGWQILSEAVVPDDKERIQETIRSFSQQGCGLILTTGGTGVGPRDVTPEAIRAIMRVELPGFGEIMRAESMKITPNSILSRAFRLRVELEGCDRRARRRKYSHDSAGTCTPRLTEARRAALIFSPDKSAIALTACRIQ